MKMGERRGFAHFPRSAAHFLRFFFLVCMSIDRMIVYKVRAVQRSRDLAGFFNVGQFFPVRVPVSVVVDNFFLVAKYSGLQGIRSIQIIQASFLGSVFNSY